MSTDKLIEAIKAATHDTFIGTYCTRTELSWNQNFDEYGRPLNCDPNYYDSSVLIDGKWYFITRRGWHVWIWNGQYKYGTAIHIGENSNDSRVLAEIDLTPDYARNN